MSVETIERAEVRNLHRDRIENVRYPVNGRPKGKGNLPDETKLAILQQKKLQLTTQVSIAHEFDVCRKTVNQLSEDDLSPDAKVKLESFTEKLGEIREKTAKLLIKKLDNETIKDGVLPGLLDIANKNYRLETNQSTQNIAVKSIAQEVIESLIAKGYPREEVIAEVRAMYPEVGDAVN